MEILLPLIIFGGGIIYSVISSRTNKEKEKRDIDPSKMERPGRSAPRRRPANSEPERQQGSGGLFDELKREFKKEYDKAMGEPASETNSQSRRIQQEDIRKRVEDERQKLEEKKQQEKKQSSMRQRSRNQSYRDKKPVERKQSERASRAKESVYTGPYDAEGDVKVADAARGIGEEISGRARYSSESDRTEMHERGREQDKIFSPKDLSFDNKAVVNGIIFNEILGKPKSRRK